MKKALSVTLFFTVLLMLCAMTTFQPKRVVFFGDSITQMGVNPGGYISLLQQEKQLAGQYELIGAGVGGNKVYDLYLRLEEDVLAKNPDMVVIWVGVNDVWHKTSGTGTDLDKFQKFYEAIVKKLQAKGIQVIVTTPAVIGEFNNYTNPQDGDLNAYSEVIRSIAATHQCPLVDLRKAFHTYELQNNKDNQEKGLLTTDRVHLSAKGNELVKAEMLKVFTRP